MYLGGNSKLIILSSSIQNGVSFVLNHAHYLGGALYVDDSETRCSTILKECFVLITYGEIFSISFLNNSAGSGGSILYGGQLNKCRLCIIADAIDERGNIIANYGYRYDAFAVFTNISKISESESISSITSQPEQVQFCQFEGEIVMMNDRTMSLYPGEEFNISVVALDQTNSPVSATVYIEKFKDEGGEYRLSPSRQSLNDHFCANLTYRLYSANEDTQVHFELYLENSCKNHVDVLSLYIFVEPCPFGFELAENQQCSCSERLMKYTQI